MSDYLKAMSDSLQPEVINVEVGSDFEYEALQEDAEGSFQYEDPKTGEIFTFKRKGIYERNGRRLVPVSN